MLRNHVSVGSRLNLMRNPGASHLRHQKRTEKILWCTAVMLLSSPTQLADILPLSLVHRHHIRWRVIFHPHRAHLMRPRPAAPAGKAPRLCVLLRWKMPNAPTGAAANDDDLIAHSSSVPVRWRVRPFSGKGSRLLDGQAATG